MKIDRRRALRVAYTQGILPPGATIIPGRPVIIVDLSRLGMLLETDWYIRPGRLVEVRVQFPASALLVRADVLRAYVSSLDWRRGLRYRAALSFSVPINVPREPDLLESCRRFMGA